ncbi:MAG: protein translocase SEC61 complex subunit gamma [archaeon]
MNIGAGIKEFFEQSKRVITISKKPDWKEFSTMVKVTTIGILLLALIGYIVILFFTMTNLGA